MFVETSCIVGQKSPCFIVFIKAGVLCLFSAHCQIVSSIFTSSFKVDDWWQSVKTNQNSFGELYFVYICVEVCFTVSVFLLSSFVCFSCLKCFISQWAKTPQYFWKHKSISQNTITFQETKQHYRTPTLHKMQWYDRKHNDRKQCNITENPRRISIRHIKQMTQHILFETRHHQSVPELNQVSFMPKLNQMSPIFVPLCNQSNADFVHQDKMQRVRAFVCHKDAKGPIVHPERLIARRLVSPKDSLIWRVGRLTKRLYVMSISKDAWWNKSNLVQLGGMINEWLWMIKRCDCDTNVNVIRWYAYFQITLHNISHLLYNCQYIFKINVQTFFPYLFDLIPCTSIKCEIDMSIWVLKPVLYCHGFRVYWAESQCIFNEIETL